MENKNKYKQADKRYDGTGQFPTDSQGKIVNNIATGYDTSARSFEMYKKTPKEKLDLSIAKSKHKAFLQMEHGKNWKKFMN